MKHGMRKFWLVTSALMLAAGTALAASDGAPSLNPDPRYVAEYTPRAGETAYNFNLKGYVFGIKMITARYKGQYGNGDYSAYSDIKTSGLGALLKKLRIWAVTDGKFDKNGIYPVTHTQQNLDKKSRRVEMRYDYPARQVSVDINPPIGSQGKPPATMEERFSADDVPSALLNLLTTGYLSGDEVCDGTIRVFDSKQHYGLRMERAGTRKVKFKGNKVDTIRCHVYYEPISGFDPEDLPNMEEGGTPVKVYFWERPDLGMSIPVRFTYKISGFKAVIKLDDMSVAKG